MVRCLQNRIRRVVELDVQVYEQEMEKVRRDVRSVDLNIVGPEWVAYSLTKLVAQAFSPFFLFLLIFTILVNLLAVIWPKISVIFESFDLNSRENIQNGQNMYHLRYC